MKAPNHATGTIEYKIKAEACRLGFSFCGITNVEPLKEYNRYENWLDQGLHAGMDYLTSPRHRTCRREPRLLVPEAKTVLSLGWPYPLRSINEISSTRQVWIAGYATGDDYHVILPEKLEEITHFIQNELGVTTICHAFTDSAPILERELAVRAGLGWIGRNSCLISPRLGSSFLLAELFVDQSLVEDEPFQKDYCGSCKRCLDACPTGCILPDRTIDSRKCISYLTIENKWYIPEEQRNSLGRWLFGCDICQMVCPWNQKKITENLKTGIMSLTIEEVTALLLMSRDEYLLRYGKSSISRVKWNNMQRNALIVLANNADPSVISQLMMYKERITDIGLIQTAQWAIEKLKMNKA